MNILIRIALVSLKNANERAGDLMNQLFKVRMLENANINSGPRSPEPNPRSEAG